jgi:nitrite reductase (cytochrome c-552)
MIVPVEHVARAGRLHSRDTRSSSMVKRPQESMRLLAEALDFSRQGQIALRDPKYKPTLAVVTLAAAPAAPAAAPAR